MYKSIFLVGLFALLPMLVWAQQAHVSLLATQAKHNQVEQIYMGETLKLAYTGYLGQLETFRGILVGITDSTLTLKKAKVFKKSTFRTIAFADIQGFRKIGIGRQLLVSLLKLTTTVGGVVLVAVLSASGTLQPWAATLVSIGFGLTSQYGIDLLFREKIKKHSNQGWRLQPMVYR